MTHLLAPEPSPATLKERPWGGQRLAKLRAAGLGTEARKEPIGESWEFSTLEGSESRCEGSTLKSKLGRDLSFLAKLIDAAKALSIQVHPADRKQGEQTILGKEEAWVILDADPEAYVLAGFREGLQSEKLRWLARNANSDPKIGQELLQSMNKIPVRPGMVLLIPAGTIHAIGPGLLLAEIQQPTDCTYRFYDYGSQRPLHVEEALEAIELDAQANIWTPDETPRTIEGQHVRLCILGQGTHKLPAPNLDTLIMPALGSCQANEQELQAGDLRLWHQGELELSCPKGSFVVLGTVE